ncbi:MAG: hypothetical protein JOZ80_03040 [Acidobacteriaceae bacterium]|nr:hypothetical protein [Acidobacteriaceae bacterium]
MPTPTPQTAPDRINSIEAEKTSKTAPKNSTARFIIPSVADLLFIALALALSYGAMGRVLLRDSDIGWHIRDGEQILLTHHIPHTDTFSSTMIAHTWYAWEWLYDLLIAGIHHVAGLNGVVFFTAILIAATFALVLRVTLRRGGNLPCSLFLLVLALGASSVHFLTRPHVLTWLFTVIWFDLLDDSASSYKAGKRLYWLPMLMILWVNLHGGFALGFSLLAIYLIGGGIEYSIYTSQRDQIASWLRHLTGITVVTIAASFVNPYGYHLHVHVYRYLSDRFLMNQIIEFRSPDFHSAAQQCFAILLISTCISLASTRQKLSPSRLLVLLFAGYSGLYATRNLPTSSLLMTLVLAPVLSATLSKAATSAWVAFWLRQLFSRLTSFGFRMQELETNLRGHILVAVVLALGIWSCVHHGQLASTQLINAQFDEKRFPVVAADYISRHDIRQPIFSLDYWGGYLIYRLYPDTKVVLDDRHDLYGDQFIKNYLKIVLVQPSFAQELDQMNVEWVLVPRWSSLANVLRLMPNWTEVHGDGTAALFHRQHIS